MCVHPDYTCWHVVWFHFLGTSVQEYYKNFIYLNNGNPVGSIETEVAAPIIRHIINYYRSGLDMNYIVDLKVAALITELMTKCLVSAYDNQRSLISKEPPAFIPKVKEYLIEHYRDPITLDFLEKKFFINKFYLQKQFLLCIGSTPCDFQRSIRLTKAKEHLRVTNYSIGDIANMVGFESVSYFITCFKKMEAKTPLQYRLEWNI